MKLTTIDPGVAITGSHHYSTGERMPESESVKLACSPYRFFSCWRSRAFRPSMVYSLVPFSDCNFAHVYSPMSYTSILANALLRFRVLRRTINDLAQSLGAKIKLDTGFDTL
jgi:hypothetical protein